MAKTNNSFGEKFKNKGEIAELAFLYIHKQNAVSLVDDKFSRKVDTDFIVINEPKNGVWDYNSNKQFVRCEVKQDNRCGDTGNLFLEDKTVRLETGNEEDGWIKTCRANELWYFDTINQRFFVFDFPKLMVYYQNNSNKLREPKPFYDREDNANKYGKLYSIEKDKAHALKKIVPIDNEDGIKDECERYLKLFNKKADKKIISQSIYDTARFVEALIFINGGEPQVYNKCFGNYEIDNYIIRHRNTKCVQNAVDTLKGVFS